jgi:L-cysteine desulfidase
MAMAWKHISGHVETIAVTVDENIYKNGARVTIAGARAWVLQPFWGQLVAVLTETRESCRILLNMT